MQVSSALNVLVVSLGIGALTGCVMSEKYEAEKARGLNFQRLLAQEEKRTAELDAELKKSRRDLGEMEGRNRELISELQSVREELAQAQEEAMAFKETATLTGETSPDVGTASTDDFLSGFGFEETGKSSPSTAAEGSPIYHEVMPGETLFRLGRTYGVKVDQIKEWNNLPDDLIEVGQQLVVGYQ